MQQGEEILHLLRHEVPTPTTRLQMANELSDVLDTIMGCCVVQEITKGKDVKSEKV